MTTGKNIFRNKGLGITLLAGAAAAVLCLGAAKPAQAGVHFIIGVQIGLPAYCPPAVVYVPPPVVYAPPPPVYQPAYAPQPVYAPAPIYQPQPVYQQQYMPPVYQAQYCPPVYNPQPIVVFHPFWHPDRDWHPRFAGGRDGGWHGGFVGHGDRDGHGGGWHSGHGRR